MNKLKKLGSAFAVVVAILVLAACPLLFSACSSDHDNDGDNDQEEQTYGESYLFIDGFTMDENEDDYTPAVGDIYELVGVWGNGGVPSSLVLYLEFFQGTTMVFVSETETVTIDPPNMGGGSDYGTYTIEDNKVIIEGMGVSGDLTEVCVIKGKNLISQETSNEVTTVNGGVAATGGLVFHLKEKAAA